MPKHRYLSAGFVETLLCTAIVWLWSVWQQNFGYIVLWSLLGWTQLLRTRQSTVLCLKWFDPVHRVLSSFLQKLMAKVGALKWMRKPHTPPVEKTPVSRTSPEKKDLEKPIEALLKFLFGGVFWMPFTCAIAGAAACTIIAGIALAALSISLWAGLTRLLAILWCMVRAPGQAFRAIPRNWRRVGWSLSMLSPLEFVPRHRLLLRYRRRSSKESDDQPLDAYIFAPKMPPKLGPTLKTAAVLAAAAVLMSLLLVVHRPVKFEFFPNQHASIAGSSYWNGRDQQLERILRGQADMLNTTVTLETDPAQDLNPKTPSEAVDRDVDAVEAAKNKYLKIFEEAASGSGDPAGRHFSKKNGPLPTGVLRDMSWPEGPLPDKAEIAQDLARRFAPQLEAHYAKHYDLFSLDSPMAVAEKVSCRRVNKEREGKVMGYLRMLAYSGILGLIFLAYTVYLGLWAVLLLYALSTPLRLVLFLPGIAYRLSLKASALTYAPLFFVGEAPFASFPNTREAFLREQEAPWPAVQRFLAKLSAFLLLMSAITATLWSTFSARLPNPAAAALAPWFLYLYPSHLATACTVALTFGTWYLTKAYLWREKQGLSVTYDKPGRWLLTMQRLRSVLSLYTVTWSIYWAATAVLPTLREINTPLVRWVLLPWNK